MPLSKEQLKINNKVAVAKYRTTSKGKETNARKEFERNKSGRSRFAQIKYKYGISEDEFNIMLGDQNGLCKICGMINDGKPLYVDHCHETGKARGLLCQRCNSAIGFFGDKTGLMEVAMKYINQSKEGVS